MKRRELTDFFDRTFEMSRFAQDVSNNGLQVEGTEEADKVLFGVDASQELFDLAVKERASFIFVHHGLSWGSEPRRFTGITAKRLATLFQHGISLYAAHLPLDAHPIYGNNAVLADMLDLRERKGFLFCGAETIGFQGELPLPAGYDEVAALFAPIQPTLHCLDSGRTIRRVAVVSGSGGMQAVFEAVEAQCDLLVTGELEHTMYFPAKENGLSVLALGHYASETTGVKAMMNLVSEKFPVKTFFGDIPTGL